MHQGCVPKAVLQGLARGEGIGHLPSPLAEHPSYCRARPSRTPRTNPPAGWRVERAWKRAVSTLAPSHPRSGEMGSEREFTPLLVRDQGVMPNPEHPSLGNEDPQTHAVREFTVCWDIKSRGPTRPERRHLAQSGDQASFLPSRDPQIRHCAGEGVPSASPMRGSRVLHGHSLSLPPRSQR